MITGTAKVVLAIIAFIVVMAFIWIGNVYIWGGAQQSTAEFRGDTGVVEDTVANADFRQQAYNQFFDLCSSVQSKEDTINVLESELDSGVSADRETQIQTNLTALRASRASNIREYNQTAQQDYTVGQFRDAGLPAELDIDNMETTCAS